MFAAQTRRCSFYFIRKPDSTLGVKCVGTVLSPRRGSWVQKSRAALWAQLSCGTERPACPTPPTAEGRPGPARPGPGGGPAPLRPLGHEAPGRGLARRRGRLASCRQRGAARPALPEPGAPSGSGSSPGPRPLAPLTAAPPPA